MKVKLESLQDTYSTANIIELFTKDAQQATMGAWLKSYVEALEQFTRDIVKHNVDISITKQDTLALKQVADMYEVILFNLQKGDDVDDFIKEMLTKAHNEVMTIRQFILGELGMDSHFYASEINLENLVQASNKALQETDTTKPIKFIQVA